MKRKQASILQKSRLSAAALVFVVFVLYIFVRYTTSRNQLPVADPAVYERVKREVPAAVGVLLDNIRDGGPFTFFAPSKAAFKHLSKLTKGNFQDESVNEHLTDLLADHILPGTVMSMDVPPHGLKMKSINGRQLHITPSHGHDLNVEGIATVATNLRVGPGVVHIISQVLLTPAYIKLLSPTTKDTKGKPTKASRAADAYPEDGSTAEKTATDLGLGLSDAGSTVYGFPVETLKDETLKTADATADVSVSTNATDHRPLVSAKLRQNLGESSAKPGRLHFAGKTATDELAYIAEELLMESAVDKAREESGPGGVEHVRVGGE
eukprot:CAMPEP_0198229892 /NCGR_PEP_ID=MMETSP1445-20131203/114361_1 /TAXON_ID=36898 /ORGANISM="Pyramimonas sp., Strain CCMP2087" /LENGTH=322 /DNA_ID=CAMNT_0043910375 /DNA_START=187 /DNA_END=1155 /DNA_ORIENTATION=+